MFQNCDRSFLSCNIWNMGQLCVERQYRGITSLCAGSKILEILVCEQLLRAVKPYISVDQHGFYPGRSISTNLIHFTSYCIRNISEGSQIDTVYTDLKSAFDKVNHKILIAKINQLGAPRNFVEWIESYLIDRRICVKLASHESFPFCNTSGVPQGSNLGPLLFSLFINDVSLSIPDDCRLLYADDVKIFRPVNSLHDSTVLQSYIDEFVDWCTNNCMSVSVEKCAVISFSRKRNPLQFQYTINGNVLERVSTFKDLGVLLDTQLTFREHYTCMLMKANRNLGFIFRASKEFKDPYCLRALYFGLVRSLLETAAVVWSPYHNNWIQRIESVQKKFVRYALRHLPWRNPTELPSYESRCRLLGMDSLKKRRDISKALFVGKLLLGVIDAPILLRQIEINAIPRNLRHRSFIRLELQRTEYSQNEPIRSMCLVFNNVYELFDFNISIDVFRNRLYFTDSMTM